MADDDLPPIDDEGSDPTVTAYGLIEPIEIEEEMERSFLDYSMSVIVSRALPDARVEIVAEAGHAAHLEAPKDFARVVRAFVASKDVSERRDRP